MADGASRIAEIHAGSGYYSQSAAACFFGWSGDRAPKKVVALWPSGATSEVGVAAGAKSVVMTAPPV